MAEVKPKLTILTVQSWWGLSRRGRLEYSKQNKEGPEDKIELESFSFRGSLTEAVNLLYDYSKLFKKKYPLTSLEFKVVGVSQICDDYEGCPTDSLTSWGPRPIEKLPKALKDFE